MGILLYIILVLLTLAIVFSLVLTTYIMTFVFLEIKKDCQYVDALVVNHKLRHDYSTPNIQLAEFRGCLPSQCLWVWGGGDIANRLMCKEKALRIAQEVNMNL